MRWRGRTGVATRAGCSAAWWKKRRCAAVPPSACCQACLAVIACTIFIAGQTSVYPTTCMLLLHAASFLLIHVPSCIRISLAMPCHGMLPLVPAITSHAAALLSFAAIHPPLLFHAMHHVATMPCRLHAAPVHMLHVTRPTPLPAPASAPLQVAVEAMGSSEELDFEWLQVCMLLGNGDGCAGAPTVDHHNRSSQSMIVSTPAHVMAVCHMGRGCTSL